MPIDRPVTMLGAAPGRTTSTQDRQRRAPRLRAEAISRGRRLDAVDGVEQDREQRADEGDEDHRQPSDDGNIRIASGIHATAGIGRSTSSGGSRLSLAQREPADRQARAPTPSDHGRTKPRAHAPEAASPRCGRSLGERSRRQRRRQHLGRRRHVAKGDDAEIELCGWPPRATAARKRRGRARATQAGSRA